MSPQSTTEPILIHNSRKFLEKFYASLRYDGSEISQRYGNLTTKINSDPERVVRISRIEPETVAKERRKREETGSQKRRRWESNRGLRLGSLLPSPLGYRCRCVHALIHQPRSIGRVSAFPIALVQCAKFKRGFPTRIIPIAAAVSAVSDSLRQFERPFQDPNQFLVVRFPYL